MKPKSLIIPKSAIMHDIAGALVLPVENPPLSLEKIDIFGAGDDLRNWVETVLEHYDAYLSRLKEVRIAASASKGSGIEVRI